MNPNPQQSEPLLIPWHDVHRVLSIFRAHLARLRVAGKFGPTILRAGRKLLVRREELEGWVNANMPDSRTWAAMQASAGRRGRARKAIHENHEI